MVLPKDGGAEGPAQQEPEEEEWEGERDQILVLDAEGPTGEQVGAPLPAQRSAPRCPRTRPQQGGRLWDLGQAEAGRRGEGARFGAHLKPLVGPC